MRRFIRTRRGAVGVAIVAAALLLWPFAELSWIPWLGGFAALVLLRLLRLDGLLRGWDVHLAGLAVVAGLMISTTPWAWGLAASIGVLLAGLALLPDWRLAACGAVLCVLAGAAFAWSQARAEQEAIAAHEPIREQSRVNLGMSSREGVLPTMLNLIAQGSPDAVCGNLLTEPARAAFAASVGQPDCAAAVLALSSRVTNRVAYENPDAQVVRSTDVMTVDACTMDWGGGPVGPQVGHLTITATQASPPRYAISTFRAC